jgi:hypothetical protein
MNCGCRTRIFIASLVIAPSAVWAQKWEFKGLELGAKSSISDLEKRFNLKCAPVAAPGSGQYCRGRTTLMEWPAELNVNLDADDFVFKISVPYKGDPLKQWDARKAMIEKFGQPTKKSGAYHEWVRKTNKSFWKIAFDPDKLEMSVYQTDKPRPSNPAMTVDPKAKKDI